MPYRPFPHFDVSLSVRSQLEQTQNTFFGFQLFTTEKVFECRDCRIVRVCECAREETQLMMVLKMFTVNEVHWHTWTDTNKFIKILIIFKKQWNCAAANTEKGKSMFFFCSLLFGAVLPLPFPWLPKINTRYAFEKQCARRTRSISFRAVCVVSKCAANDDFQNAHFIWGDNARNGRGIGWCSRLKNEKWISKMTTSWSGKMNESYREKRWARESGKWARWNPDLKFRWGTDFQNFIGIPISSQSQSRRCWNKRK